MSFPDSCKVDNGGCDENADCSHDAKSYAVICTCKNGYTNVGKDQKIVCEGNVTLFYAAYKSELCCSDSCKVENGGCDEHADCSHDKKSYAVVCTCKTGYTNTGKGGKVVCQGNLDDFPIRIVEYLVLF